MYKIIGGQFKHSIIRARASIIDLFHLILINHEYISFSPINLNNNN